MQFPILPDARDRQCSIGQDAKLRKENKVMAENQNTEYKQNWHDDHLRWICGFANADGGKLYIGVNDHGTVSGIENHKYLMNEIPSKIRNLLGITANVNLKTIDQNITSKLR